MKKRIIPSILLRGGTQVCLSQEFSPWRSVGSLVQNLRLHVGRSADELLIVNLDLAGRHQFTCPERIIRLVRQEVDIPIAYAGGIRTASDASACINAGFDKVYITSAFLDDPSVVHQISSVIGSQSLGLSLPYRRLDECTQSFVYDYRSKALSQLDLLKAIELGASSGAGEILLHDISRDGTLIGFDPMIVADLDLLQPTTPVILAGGAGEPNHFLDVLNSPSVQGVVASSIFSLTPETPATIRRVCTASGIAMRRCTGVLSTPS